MGDEILERIKGDLLEQIMNCILPLLNRQATVIFTGGKADAEGLLKIVDGLLATKAKIVVSDSFLAMSPPEFKSAISGRLLADYAAMQKHIAGSKLVTVPILSRNTLAKVASGIQDNLAVCGVAGALMRGVPVIAVKDNCDPDGSHFHELGLDKNPAYSEMLRDHERKLTSFGVKLVDSAEFGSALERGLYGDIFSAGAIHADAKPEHLKPEPSKPADWLGAPAARLTDSFITCEDLMKFQPGTTVEVARTAVLTPLAKEYIERGRITVTFDAK
jgi:hypothetical protein